jgi:tetratricopeptide (TPR) repeat protein
MNPKELEQRYAKAIAAHQAGRISEAESIYTQLLKAVPDADAVNTNMAALQYSKGNHARALKYVDKALTVNPLNPDALVNRASILVALQRNEDAYKAFEAVLAVDPKNALAHYNLGNLQFQLGHKEQAAASLRKALDLKPDLFQAAFNLGNVLVDARRNAEALPLFERTLILAPTHEGAHLNLSNVYLSFGMTDKAFLQVHLALEMLPESWTIWNLRSRMELDNGLDEEALRSADRAIEIHRDNIDGWLHRGNALRALDRLDEAYDAYQMALAIAPDHVGALRNLRRMSAEGIPSWHFHMLADTARNAAFDTAIKRVVKPGDLVLDIGTGSGLLAMMAARAGAAKVVACEATRSIADTAKTIVELNGYADKIDVYGMHSGLLKVGKQLPTRANVIVTEILDAALLGEGMLPSIRAALYSLATPDAIVVPAAATACAQLVHIPNHLSQGKLGNVEGFDLREFERFRIPKEYEVVHMESSHSHGRSEVLPIKHINFTQLPAAIEEERPERFAVTFQRLTTGWVNGLCLWFVLELDAETRVSSGPGGELRHWGQALFFFEEPVFVQAGGSMEIQCAFSDVMWQFWHGDKS